MRWRPKKKPAKKNKPAPRPKASANGARTKGAKAKAKAETPKPKKLSRLQKPANMSLEDWQRELRRQFGREQKFKLRNLGDEVFFSEFEVTNPESRNVYQVHIRGTSAGDNHCTCPDFATNTLGTCKHIEFTLASLERKKGGKKALRDGFQPEFSEVFLHYGAQREVRFRPGTSCPVQVARRASQYFGEDGSMLPEAYGKIQDFLGIAEKHDHELRIYDDVLSFIAEVRDAERRKEIIQKVFPRGGKSAVFKDLVKATLYDYQREGIIFAAQAGRCLIGDDMGLGKTLQAIATAEIMARHFGVERVLIVCPTSLKHQWQREIERFVKRKVEVINGLRARRERCFAKEAFFKVMNYDTVHTDLDLISGWSPDLVILDEAQRIKNWATRTARSVKKIQSPYALVLTGTPLENRLEELISIVQFVDRHRLGPTFRLLHEHQLRDGYGKVIGYQNLDRIGQTLSPILIRRHKDQVLDQLPERIDSNVFLPMTELQQKHHRENLELVALIVQKWRKYRFLSEADQRRLMIGLLRMRMSCDNSYLVDHKSDQGPKADELITLLGELMEQPGVKVVVFSQWLRMHEIIQRRLQGKKWGHVVFHGGVPTSKRKDLIDRFRDDPKCRLFLSTDAGGTGLNLQHASVVINMDLPWNPAVLEQRIGRVHRLGQNRAVRVVNFISQGTIEEGMLGVLKFKKSLFAGVLDGGEKDVFLGGSKLNKFMETVEAATAAIPEAVLEDAGEALFEGREQMDSSRRAGTGSGQPFRRSGGGKAAPRPTVIPSVVIDGSEEEETPVNRSVVPAASDPWTGLLQVGMALLQQMTTPQPANGASSGGQKSAASQPKMPQVVRDEKTGETYVKMPMPSPEVVEQVVKAVGALLESFRK